MMASEKGPNRLNMKFTDCGRKVVIHLVGDLPPKISSREGRSGVTFRDRLSSTKL
jgi:hypothetical protein